MRGILSWFQEKSRALGGLSGSIHGGGGDEEEEAERSEREGLGAVAENKEEKMPA